MSSAPTLAELADQHPRAAAVLERYGLDYCCGGRRPLDEACRQVGIDPAEVTDAIAAAAPSDAAAPAWATLDAAALVDHIEATHHRYLHEELPRLAALATKVRGVHGGSHPELADVEDLFGELRDDLEPHLLKEERILFPLIRQLSEGADPATFHCGTLQNPISTMLREHDRAGDLLASLRRITAGYEPPADACASYRALYDGLRALEEDTHLHVHKENNRLFPLVAQLEAERAR